MSASLESARVPRPLDFWIDRYPPGYLAQTTASEADPLAIATEIERQATEFSEWLRLPAEQRWDAYRLQAFSAVLFNRYRTGQPSEHSSSAARELLDLVWPDGSEEVREALASLRSLLRAPLAVYKMLRIAADAGDYPTPQELDMAMAALESSLDKIQALAARLKAALADYEHHQRCALSAQAAQRHRGAQHGGRASRDLQPLGIAADEFTNL